MRACCRVEPLPRLHPAKPNRNQCKRHGQCNNGASRLPDLIWIEEKDVIFADKIPTVVTKQEVVKGMEEVPPGNGDPEANGCAEERGVDEGRAGERPHIQPLAGCNQDAEHRY